MNRPLLRLAFAGSILVYAGIGYFLSRFGNLQPSAVDQARQMAPILAIAYAVAVLLIAPRLGAGEKGFIPRLACYEAGALFGLVLFFLSGNMTYLLAFGAVAFVLVLMAS